MAKKIIKGKPLLNVRESMESKLDMKRLDREQTRKAVSALLGYLKKQAENKKASEEKQNLFADVEEEVIYVQLSMKKFPQQLKVNPRRIPLKHSIYGRDGQEVCLFTKDPEADYEAALEQTPVKNVTRVIGISKLRKEHGRYKDQRDLLASYDLFLADSRILPLLGPMLGKKFFLKKKQPLSVNISGNMKKNLEEARDSTQMVLSGPTIMIRIATSGNTGNEIMENILDAIPRIVYHIPKRWSNIQSLMLKTSESAALPFYLSLPDDNLMNEEELAAYNAKQAKAEEYKQKAQARKELRKANKKRKGISATTATTTTEEQEEQEAVKKTAATPRRSTRSSTKKSKKK